MKKFIKKYKQEIIILAILSVIYLITRLVFLTKLPMFTDEAIYIFWGKFVATDYSHWFISVTDGKPPLLIWMMFPFFKILPSSWYLIAGRLPSVLAGWSALIAILLLTRLMFKSNRASIIAAGFYLFLPYFLLYDRMALFDSLLNSMLLWTTYFALRTSKTLKLRDALLWGFFLGLSFLSKATAIMFMGLLPVAAFLFISKKEALASWKKIILYSILAGIIGEAMNNAQRVSHAYYLTLQKNAQFQIPLSEILKDPFTQTFMNLHAAFSWIIPYVTLPIFVLCIICLVFLLVKKAHAGLILLMLWIVPIVFLCLVGRIIFPRYFLFTTPYLILPAAFAIDFVFTKFKKLQWIFAGGIILLFIPAFQFDYYLYTNPILAPFPTTDKYQYVYDHPSGYGLDQVYNYINNEVAHGKKVSIVTQGTFGLYPYAFNLEYWNNSQVKIVPKYPLDKIDSEIIKDSKDSEVLFIFKEVKQIPPELPIDLVFTADKPGDKYDILVGKLKSQNEK